MKAKLKCLMACLFLALAAHLTNCGDADRPNPETVQPQNPDVQPQAEAPLEIMFTQRHGFAANAATQTSNGDYMVVGSTNAIGHGKSDVYVMRLNAMGEMLWENAYGTEDNEVGQAIQQTEEGLYIVAGGGECTFLILIDENGNAIWEKTYCEPTGQNGSARAVVQTTGGGYALAGAGTYPSMYDSQTGYVAKFDSNGEKLWRKQYGGYWKYYASCYALVESLGGDEIFVTGVVGYVTGITQSIFVEGFLQDGGSGKSYSYSYPVPQDVCLWYSMDRTSDNGLILVGKRSSVLYDDPEKGIFLVKLNASLSEEWYRIFGNTPDDVGYGVKQTPDGGYVIVGNTTDANTGHSVLYLVKTDSQGDMLWERFYKGIQQAKGKSVALTTGGGCIVSGNTSNSLTGESGIYILITDEYGNVE